VLANSQESRRFTETEPNPVTDWSQDRVVVACIVVFCLLLVATYLPVLKETAEEWSTDENYSHGFLVIPCTVFLLWLKRSQLRESVSQPSLWGVLPLLIGLMVQVIGWVLNILYIGMWSLIPTLAGACLLLFGRKTWTICRFPILFLIFAAPISNLFQGNINQALQHISTVSAVSIMSSLGYVSLTHGNIIMLPGVSLEVAQACSGFNKCISMLTFATFYGYLSTASNLKRLVIAVLSLPIALFANIFRICLLFAVSTYGGLQLFHIWHDPAEYIAIVLAFIGLISVGKFLKCDPLGCAQSFA
jgi:exosortase